MSARDDTMAHVPQPAAQGVDARSADDAFGALFAHPVNPDAAAEPTAPPPASTPWKVLVADNDDDMRAALQLALHDMTVDGHGLQLLQARSAAEARDLLAVHDDIALVLLDVVMETDQAGLELVRHIRHELANHAVQIVLVTGQPGYAPPRDVVVNCEINGYRLKSELTAEKIFVSVHTALRAAQATRELEAQRQRLQAQTRTLEQQQRHLAHYQQHLEQLVLARTQALEESSRHLAETQFAMDRAGIGIAWIHIDSGRFLYVNDEASRQVGYTREELLGMSVAELNPGIRNTDLRRFSEALRETDCGAPVQTLHRRKDGSLYPAELKTYVRRTPAQDWFIVFFSDITERVQAASEAQARMAALQHSNAALAEANEKLRQTQSQLVQSEKMASLGLLAAGVAHEINNPIGYVKSNMSSLAEYIASFGKLLQAYAHAEAALPAQAHAFAEARRVAQDVDLAYMQQDVGALLQESLGGLERVAKIVRDLKDFSRADCDETWAFEDLHDGLESTLNVIWNQLKYSCEVKREYGALPAVECLLPQLNQIFMNLLVNAAQAIDSQGTLHIRTGCEADEVWVEVADTGRGIAPEHLPRIFDPFFTTKPVGKGTGLGLSVSYSIAQKHHGRIEVHSTVGQGSRFRLWLPVRQPHP